MKCHEALRFLSPYIDSELDRKTSFEIADHLEKCPGCAERFTREIAFEKTVAAQLREPEKADSETDRLLWTRIENLVNGEAARARPRRRWRWIAVGLVLVLTSVALVWFALARETSHTPFGVLGKGACHSHEGFVAGTETPELATSVPSEASAFFKARLGLDVAAPPPSALTLVGARRCAFGKVHVAYFMGRVRDEPVSAFVFPVGDLASFPEAQVALNRGFGPAKATCRSTQLVVAANDRIVVCAIAASGTVSLEPLVESLLEKPH